MVSTPPTHHIRVTHEKDWTSSWAENNASWASADASRASADLDRERAETERAKRRSKQDAEIRRQKAKSEKEFKALQKQLEEASNTAEIMNTLHQMAHLPALPVAQDFAFKYIQFTQELTPQEKISLLGPFPKVPVFRMLPSLLSDLNTDNLKFDALMPSVSKHGQKKEEDIQQQLNEVLDIGQNKGKKGQWQAVKKMEPVIADIINSMELTDTQKMRLSLQSLKTLAKTNENWFAYLPKMKYGSFLGFGDGKRQAKFEDNVGSLLTLAAYHPVITVRGVSLLA